MRAAHAGVTYDEVTSEDASGVRSRARRSVRRHGGMQRVTDVSVLDASVQAETSGAAEMPQALRMKS